MNGRAAVQPIGFKFELFAARAAITIATIAIGVGKYATCVAIVAAEKTVNVYQCI